MWIIKVVAVGFFTAIGWGVADVHVVQPYIVPKTKIEIEGNNQKYSLDLSDRSLYNIIYRLENNRQRVQPTNIQAKL